LEKHTLLLRELNQDEIPAANPSRRARCTCLLRDTARHQWGCAHGATVTRIQRPPTTSPESMPISADAGPTPTEVDRSVVKPDTEPSVEFGRAVLLSCVPHSRRTAASSGQVAPEPRVPEMQ
jgi:hypothetical protein